MNKSWFQLGIALYVFAAFCTGIYLYYRFFYPSLLHILSGGAPSTKVAALSLTILGFAALLVALLLAASIQIFRTGRWTIFKYLLYASIPLWVIPGYTAYQFYFMPYFYCILGVAPKSFAFSMDFSLYPIMFGFNFSLFGQKTDLLQIGINVVPIIVIIILHRVYRKA